MLRFFQRLMEKRNIRKHVVFRAQQATAKAVRMVLRLHQLLMGGVYATVAGQLVQLPVFSTPAQHFTPMLQAAGPADPRHADWAAEVSDCEFRLNSIA